MAALLVCGGADNTADCCPACTADNGACPFTGFVLARMANQTFCEQICPKSCMVTPELDSACIPETCGPNPCVFGSGQGKADGKALVGRPRPAAVGQCAVADNSQFAPNKTAGIVGAVIAMVNVSETLRFHGGVHQIAHGWNDVVYEHISTAGSTLYTTNKVGTQYFLLARNATTEFQYAWWVGSDDDIVSYGSW